jgi:hypothetical protein
MSPQPIRAGCRTKCPSIPDSVRKLAGLIDRSVRGYVATGRAGRPASGTKGGTLVQAMRARIRQRGHRSRYRLQTCRRTVFGHINYARGFRQLLLRGIEKVSNERAMLCTAHNIAKLAAWA